MQLERHNGAPSARTGGTNDLADILERVLDKGIVVAGDIAVSLLDIELLTIKLRLLIASADTAREMGIDWWEHDPFLNSRAKRESIGDGNGNGNGNGELTDRLDRIEAAVEALAQGTQGTRGKDG